MGSPGVTDVSKYCKLSKITNFLQHGFDATQKIVLFHNNVEEVVMMIIIIIISDMPDQSGMHAPIPLF